MCNRGKNRAWVDSDFGRCNGNGNNKIAGDSNRCTEADSFNSNFTFIEHVEVRNEIYFVDNNGCFSIACR